MNAVSTHMNAVNIRRRWWRRAATLAGVLCGLLAAPVPVAPASAHGTLVRTTPAAGTILAHAPMEVLLTFSEPVSPVAGKLRVTDPGGTRADRGDPVRRGSQLAIPVRTDAPRGTYLVTYRVISSDGHPIGGGFSYSVGAPSPTPAAGDAAADETDPLVRGLIPVTKFLGYAGLALVVGPALMLMFLWPQRLPRRGPARLVWLGLGLIGLGTMAGLLLQVPYAAGTPLTGITAGGVREVLGTSLGTIYLVRLAALVVGALLLRRLLAGGGGTGERGLLAICAVVGLATWPLSGHPAASPAPVVSVLADAAHLAGMAVWLGGLVMLIGFLLRRARDSELVTILPVWSRWAVVAVCTLVLAGTLNALVEVRAPKALVTTTYGWLILAKVGLVAAVLGVAAWSRRMVRAGTAAERPGRLRRLVGAELAVSAVVIAVAAALVQTTPARVAAAAYEAANAPYSAMLTGRLYALKVDIAPARVGGNTVRLYAYTKDQMPQPVVDWKATAAPAGAPSDPLEIPLLPIADNQARGDVTLPSAGSWVFRFTLRLSEIDQSTVVAAVTVK